MDSIVGVGCPGKNISNIITRLSAYILQPFLLKKNDCIKHLPFNSHSFVTHESIAILYFYFSSPYIFNFEMFLAQILTLQIYKITFLIHNLQNPFVMYIY
jgi:hypothetical protein